MIYVNFEASEAQSFTQNLMLLSLALVISVPILYFISELCSILQGKINAIIFILLKWEGNWGKSGELTYTLPHTRLAEYKTEPSGRFPVPQW